MPKPGYDSHVVVWLGVETDRRPNDLFVKDQAVSEELDRTGTVEVAGEICGQICSGFYKTTVGFGIQLLDKKNPTAEEVEEAKKEGEVYKEDVADAFHGWGWCAVGVYVSEDEVPQGGLRGGLR